MIDANNEVKFSVRLLKSVFSIYLVLFLSACATIDPKPFVQFNNTANELTSIDAIIGDHGSTLKQKDMLSIATDPNLFSHFALEFNANNPYQYKYKFTATEEPLFIKLDRFQQGLNELNSTFIKYTGLLVKLSGNEIANNADFETLADDLNTNAKNALVSLGKKPDAANLALFSTLASTAAQAYINNKKKIHLEEILVANQPLVNGFVDQARVALSILAVDLQVSYDLQQRLFLNDWLQASAVTDKETLTEKRYKNNEVMIKTLQMLEALDKSYIVLAQTHKDLARNIENNGFSANNLLIQIEYVKKRYEDLKKANETASTQ